MGMITANLSIQYSNAHAVADPGKPRVLYLLECYCGETLEDEGTVSSRIPAAECRKYVKRSGPFQTSQTFNLPQFNFERDRGGFTSFGALETEEKFSLESGYESSLDIPEEYLVNVLPSLPNQLRNIGNDNLDVGQRRRIRELAQALRIAADSVVIGPGNDRPAVERAVLADEGLSQDEMQVVQNILSEKTPTTVSKVADHLSRLVTSRTVRATLRYLCYSTRSVNEEVAVACELVKLTFPALRQLSRSNSVLEVINEFFQNRLDNILR